MLYAGAIRLTPGRCTLNGGENSSPRSILVNVASTSEMRISKNVDRP